MMMSNLANPVVSRAGASSLGEFPLFGLPAILVPYPHAWRYQKTNADYLVKQGAAVRLDDGQLIDQLAQTVKTILLDADRRESMSEAARALMRPDAAQKIAQVLVDQADTVPGPDLTEPSTTES